MARTITEIKTQMTSAFVSNPQIIDYYGLDNTKTFDQQFSKLSIESIIFSTVASAMYVLEGLFDTLKTYIEYLLSEKGSHNKRWYSNKAKAFQYGYSLVDDTDNYATLDLNAQIIKHASVDEINDGFLQIKVAKESSDTLAALSEIEYNSFSSYMSRIKDAGVNLRIISNEADYLRLVIDIFYDPIVLSSIGERLDGNSNTSIQDAISSYLENLPFNGEFSIMALTDAIQVVDGVKVVQVQSAESKYGTTEFSIVSAIYQPYAGWMKVYNAEDLGLDIITNDESDYVTVTDGYLTINWRPYGE